MWARLAYCEHPVYSPVFLSYNTITQVIEMSIPDSTRFHKNIESAELGDYFITDYKIPLYQNVRSAFKINPIQYNLNQHDPLSFSRLLLEQPCKLGGFSVYWQAMDIR